MSENNDTSRMFQTLVELTNAIHWEMDLVSRRFTYVSPQIRTILGYSPEKWDTFDAWAATVHPDDRKYAIDYCMAKTEKSEDHSFVYRVLDAEGKTVWFQDTVKVITSDGKPVRLLGIMFDITAQKRAETELRTHGAIFDNLAEGVCLIGAGDFRIKWVNHVFENMFGYDTGELPGMPIDVVNAPTDRTPEETREAIVSVIQETGDWHGEVLNIKKDGTTFWCHANVSVLDHPEYGRVFVSVNSDISGMKGSEEALRTSERRSRTIISASPIGIVVANADGKAVSTNQAMADIIGATEEQILKQNYHELESWKRSGMYDKAVSAVRNNRTEHLDVEHVSSFGKKIYISAYFTPMGSGELLIMLQDITELLKVQNELNKALEDKDVLMREVVHRAKNSLMVIQSLLSLHAQDSSDERSRGHFTDARNRVQSMALIYDMLNSVKDVTRLGCSEYVHTLVGALLKNFRLGSRDVRVQFDIEDIDLDVDTMIPLGLIINELVTNAMKYAFTDETEGVLGISLRTTGDERYELVIRDNGAGLPEGFDIMNVKSFGLKIMNALVTAQINGTLEVSSTEGAEFRIRFSKKAIE